MQQPLDILKEYWNFDAFRTSQEGIIQSVLAKKDTLALLPTGGGKSVCFQVPALANSGICIVISPLVALIKDQVESLKGKGIKAIALTSGLKYHEVDALLDNCIYGNYKFLYLSPERLQQELVQERIKQMPVNLIAVDEAHCISQWGNDFRPAYKNCNLLRDFFPDIPIIALTASATPKVVADIVDDLQMKDAAIIKKSYKRENIAYMVFDEADKLFKLEQILKKNKGSSIVYVRNRKATIDVSELLQKKGITATFYHGGIPPEEKDKKLQLWLADQVQVMVATNAFGMGIDKPNVKTVIHINLPDTIESYFQEAGRAGRDGQKAFAVLLKNKGDEDQVKKQFLDVLPDVDFIKLLYRKLNSYFQISFGEGENEVFAFNFNDFCHVYKLNPILVFNGMKLLDRHSIIGMSETFSKKTSIQFTASNHQLFIYLDKNPRLETIAQAILRTYGGVFDTQTKINTLSIANKTSATEAEVINVLEQLSKDNIINYKAHHTDAEITFLVPREDDNTIYSISKVIKQQNQLKEQQVQSVIDYIQNERTCKSVQLLSYFGEDKSKPCGICSVCISKKKSTSSEILDIVVEQVLRSLKKEPMTSRKLTEILTFKEHCILEVLQMLLEQENININSKNEYYIVT